VGLHHLLRELVVATSVQRPGTPLRGVEAARRNGQEAAEHSDGKGHLLLGDERELHALSLAKKVAALFRISRSIRRTFTSRRRCESSSFSAVVRAPGAPFPASTSAWRTHARIKLSASPRSRASSLTRRPPA